MIDFSAINNGYTDAAPALNRLLAQGGTVRIPQGEYRVTTPLLIPSGTTLIAHPQARFLLLPERPLRAHECLLSNANDLKGGDHDITVTGGIWDGVNTCPYNKKQDIFDLNGYSGTVLSFFGVKGLTLRDLTVANSETYNIRMACVEDFRIEDISFVSDVVGQNQDGLHFNGGCHRGVVRRIRALSKGQTNDDLIALNADDSMLRVENVGMIRGDITDIDFEDLYAQDCHTIIRLLSVDHAIRDITIRNVYGGFRCYAINADAARYCRTPLFREEDMPDGVGEISRVTISGMTCRPTVDPGRTANPAIIWESRADTVRLTDFRLLPGTVPTDALLCRHVPGLHVRTGSRDILLQEKQDTCTIPLLTELLLHSEAVG